MATKPLPFYEKDAQKWSDLVSISQSELKQILRENPNWKCYSQLESVIWQLTIIVHEIENALAAKRRKQ